MAKPNSKAAKASPGSNGPDSLLGSKPAAVSYPAGQAIPGCGADCMVSRNFGRLLSIDLRDAKWRASRFLSRRNIREARERTYQSWHTGPAIDQGNHPACVGYSWRQLLTTGPVRNVNAAPDPLDLYRRAQQLDEWPGEDYEGSSVRAGALALRELGVIPEFAWSWDAEEIAVWIISKGPVVFGTIWLDSMMRPDEKGWLKVEKSEVGGALGGHAYMLYGANLTKRCPDGTKGAFLIQNSWGPNWGPMKGRAYLSMSDAQVLLDAAGECCMPTELKPGAWMKQ